MDFMNRNTQQPATARTASSGGAQHDNGGNNNAKKNASWHNSPTWLRIVWVVLLFSGTILAVAIAALLYFGGAKEANYIDDKKLQAVFLQNGQVYFGNVETIKGDYMDLRNIYYLSVDQSVQPEQSNNDDKAENNNVSLVKLGCELHGPVDQMIINRDQITFWENLKDDGQVAKAVAKWVEQNPEGQKCNETNQQDTANDTPASTEEENNNEEE